MTKIKWVRATLSDYFVNGLSLFSAEDFKTIDFDSYRTIQIIQGAVVSTIEKKNPFLSTMLFLQSIE